MNGRMGDVVLSIVCVGAILAVAIILIVLRLRVGRLHARPSVQRGGGTPSHDANPREFDSGSDDGGDADDGGDGGDA